MDLVILPDINQLARAAKTSGPLSNLLKEELSNVGLFSPELKEKKVRGFQMQSFDAPPQYAGRPDIIYKANSFAVLLIKYGFK